MTAEQTSHTMHERSADDVRLGQVLEKYLADLEAGRYPDETQLIADNPDIADRLRDCLDSLSVVRQVTPGLGSTLPLDDVTKQPTLGDFRLVREIGRGGMGVVYEAEQLSLDRRVAVKILPFAAFLDPRHLQRFKQEALAAAVLRHPNIVGVYCVGCERGLHFYAMELIEGPTLADVIRQLRTGELSVDPPQETHSLPNAAIDTVPIAALSTQHAGHRSQYYRSIARLGIQAAEALEYAHQQGIVHRDIKPANLMLDQAGKVWISDFGLAQAAGHHELTLSGDLLGTLRYMSPEQAEGKKLLDHRTDVYSLGVTLYELLTLQPAFSGENRQQLLSQVTEGRPLLLRGQDRLTPRDLETIIRKATALRPEGRYDTAQEFADDLRRFVNNEPILARPPRRWETLRRAAARNPVAAGLAIVAVVLVIFLATAGPLAAINYRQLADKERESRHEAVDSRQHVQAILDRALTGIDESINDPQQLEALQTDLLTDVVEYYEGLLRKNSSDPDIRLAAAVARREVTHAFTADSSASQRIAFYRRCLTALDELVCQYPENDQYAFELAGTLRFLGQSLGYQRVTDEAVGHCRRAIAIMERLVDASPAEEVSFRHRLNMCRYSLACCLDFAGWEPAEVEKQLLLAKAGWLELASRPNPDLLHRGSAGACQAQLGFQYRLRNRFSDAERELTAALSLFAAVVQDGFRRTPNSSLFGSETRIETARLMNSLYRFDESKDYLTVALDDIANVLSAFPRFGWGRIERQKAYRELSYVEWSLGNVDAAEAALRDALQREKELAEGVGDADQQPITHFWLGQLLWRCNRRAEAKSEFCLASKAFASLKSPGDALRPRLVFLATCPDLQYRDASRAVQLARAALHPDDQQMWRVLGLAEYRAGDYAGAITALQQSMERRSGGDAIDWLFLAMANWQVGQRETAWHWYQQSVDALDNKLPVCLDVITHPAQLEEFREEAAALIDIGSAEVAKPPP